MKLFEIIADDYSYLDYDRIVVACESKEKLQELIDEGYFTNNDKCYKKNGYFKQGQKLSIEEIDLDSLTDTTTILASCVPNY